MITNGFSLQLSRGLYEAVCRKRSQQRGYGDMTQNATGHSARFVTIFILPQYFTFERVALISRRDFVVIFCFLNLRYLERQKNHDMERVVRNVDGAAAGHSKNLLSEVLPTLAVIMKGVFAC
jgi:hypothetical protein